MYHRYHNLQLALYEAGIEANSDGQPRYVTHWASWYGVFDLAELCLEALPAEYTIYPNLH